MFWCVNAKIPKYTGYNAFAEVHYVFIKEKSFIKSLYCYKNNDNIWVEKIKKEI